MTSTTFRRETGRAPRRESVWGSLLRSIALGVAAVLMAPGDLGEWRWWAFVLSYHATVAILRWEILQARDRHPRTEER